MDQLDIPSTIPACLSLMCSFNRIIMKGLALRKFMFDVCVCMFCSMFMKVLILWTDLTKVYICEKF